VGKAAELAREEATRAEQGEDEQENGGGPGEGSDDLADEEQEREESAGGEAEGHATPAPEQLTEAQVEARSKAWDRERDRHMRELEKRWPERYKESEACILCQGHGLYYATLPEPFHTQRRQFIMSALGENVPPAYRDHPTEELCEQCAGWGKLATGSHVVGQDLLNCPACAGTGHKAKQQPMPQVVQFQPSAPPPHVPPPAFQSQQGLDAWQRPPGHPHYGIPPSAVGV